MDTTESVRHAMRGLSIRQLNKLSVDSGVPFRTLYKIKLGYTKDPRMSTVDALSKILAGKKRRSR